MRETDPVEERVAALERRQTELENRMNDFGEKLAHNTETTQAIKADTAQLILLFKASQIGAIIIKWCTAVGSAVIIGYAAIKGLRA
jgi:hypothetical protein